jgi:hypothetical protein
VYSPTEHSSVRLFRLDLSDRGNTEQFPDGTIPRESGHETIDADDAGEGRKETAGLIHYKIECRTKDPSDAECPIEYSDIHFHTNSLFSDRSRRAFRCTPLCEGDRLFFGKEPDRGSFQPEPEQFLGFPDDPHARVVGVMEQFHTDPVRV